MLSVGCWYSSPLLYRQFTVLLFSLLSHFIVAVTRRRSVPFRQRSRVAKAKAYIVYERWIVSAANNLTKTYIQCNLHILQNIPVVVPKVYTILIVHTAYY